MATADFINRVGFEADGKPRKVKFDFQRPAPIQLDHAGQDSDAQSRDNVRTNVEHVELSVPFLAIVNVPSLAVKTVDITFDMEVKSSESAKSSTSGSVDASGEAHVGWGPFSMDVKVHGSVSTHKENTRKSDKSAKYHVALQARDDGMPEGLSRVMDIMQSAIAPVVVDPSKPGAGHQGGSNQGN